MNNFEFKLFDVDDEYLKRYEVISASDIRKLVEGTCDFADVMSVFGEPEYLGLEMILAYYKEYVKHPLYDGKRNFFTTWDHWRVLFKHGDKSGVIVYALFSGKIYVFLYKDIVLFKESCFSEYACSLGFAARLVEKRYWREEEETGGKRMPACFVVESHFRWFTLRDNVLKAKSDTSSVFTNSPGSNYYKLEDLSHSKTFPPMFLCN